LRRNPGLRVGKVASVLELPHFSATRLVQHLEVEDLVARVSDPADRRAVLLSLSSKALGLIKDIEDRSYQLVKAYASGLSESELAGFVMVAENLDKILGVSDRALETVRKPE